MPLCAETDNPPVNVFVCYVCRYSSSKVTGWNGIGGLVGSNWGNITTCRNTGIVTGNSLNVGGLAGMNFGSISTSYSTGAVSGDNYVGGLIGWICNGSVINSYSTGFVTVYKEEYKVYNAGGLIGGRMNSWSAPQKLVQSL